jgi:hypothetical protein
MNDWISAVLFIFLFVILALAVPEDKPMNKEWTQLEFDFEGKDNE